MTMHIHVQWKPINTVTNGQKKKLAVLKGWPYYSWAGSNFIT